MLKSFLSLCLFMASFENFAEIPVLDRLELSAKNFYLLGDDNNYLTTKHISTTEFFSFSPIEIFFDRQNNSELYNLLKNCVFMTRGAYGEHLPLKLQERIIKTFSELIYNTNNYNHILLYKTENSRVKMNTGIDGSECLMAIKESDGNEVLLLQASIID